MKGIVKKVFKKITKPAYTVLLFSFLYLSTSIFEIHVSSRNQFYFSILLKNILDIYLLIYFSIFYIFLLKYFSIKFLKKIEYKTFLKKELFYTIIKMNLILIPFVIIISYHIFNFLTFFNEELDFKYILFHKLDHWGRIGEFVSKNIFEYIYYYLRNILWNDYYVTLLSMSGFTFVCIVIITIIIFFYESTLAKKDNIVIKKILKSLKQNTLIYENVMSKNKYFVINQILEEIKLKHYLNIKNEENLNVANYKNSQLIVSFKKASEPPLVVI
ncbi:hypothetical protein SGLAD_v1c05260 [Spiroplasma gladiatoris]|uniref:Uncharacterized protein n=1 Tax=Spiroplasma gladiatoris TaxID=2143 RepID=A0A4P7AH29_9MOLU|nr:hypothetical protein [Spiroplasma gladiatoris]QBQ07725.1 hypothetical protein SGLAD_v1c05260 [Spiroplasma gladiatoris]